MASLPELRSEPGAWALLSQGRSSAVFAYHGTDPGLVGRVLRVRKDRAGEFSADPALEALERRLWPELPLAGAAADPASLDEAYKRLVVAPAVGPEHLLASRAVALPGPLHAGLVAATGLRLLPVAQLMTDARSLLDPQLEGPRQAPDSAPSLCLELKPKCGLLPPAPGEGAGLPSLPHLSRFQLRQRQKLAEGRVARLSGYDPLDLFSGDPARMLGALGDLLAEPQNNLRCFAGGRQLAPGGLRAALDADPLGARLGGWRGLSRLLVAILRAEGVLARVLGLQGLDAHGAEHAHATVQQLLDASRPSTAEERGGALQALRAYLTAATFKDLSLMVVLRPSAHSAPSAPGAADGAPALWRVGPRQRGVLEGGSAVLSGSGVAVAYSVALVDLDLKRLHKVGKHAADDRLMRTLAAEALQREPDRLEEGRQLGGAAGAHWLADKTVGFFSTPRKAAPAVWHPHAPGEVLRGSM